MSIVDQVKSLSIDIEDDEYYKSLLVALEEYHKMIDLGQLKPRDNNVQNIYTPVLFSSNY